MVEYRTSQITGGVTVNGVSTISFKSAATATSVTASTKTTILTAVFAAGSFTNIALVSVSGQDYAKYYLTLNGSDIDIRRSGPDRNLQFDFKSNPLNLVSGDTVDIKVEHFFTAELLDFEATIYGYST